MVVENDARDEIKESERQRGKESEPELLRTLTLPLCLSDSLTL
jgi:hypothetical protein